jgi:hypothetical protein
LKSIEGSSDGRLEILTARFRNGLWANRGKNRKFAESGLLGTLILVAARGLFARLFTFFERILPTKQVRWRAALSSFNYSYNSFNAELRRATRGANDHRSLFQ